MLSVDVGDFVNASFALGNQTDASSEPRSEATPRDDVVSVEPISSKEKRPRGRPTKTDMSVLSLFCRWDDCGGKFDTANEARAHERKHVEAQHDGSFVCLMKVGFELEETVVCRKKFGSARQLRKHMVLHQPRQLACEICGKSFHDMGKLIRHRKVHTGEKTFVCEICNKGFGLSANLKTHMRIHSGERPFLCSFPGCNKRFAQACNRKTHEQNAHKRASETNDPHISAIVPLTSSFSTELAFQSISTSDGLQVPLPLPLPSGNSSTSFWSFPGVYTSGTSAAKASNTLRNVTTTTNQNFTIPNSGTDWGFPDLSSSTYSQQHSQGLTANGDFAEEYNRREFSKGAPPPVAEDASLLLLLQQNRQQQ